MIVQEALLLIMQRCSLHIGISFLKLLERQFVVVREANNPPCIELLTDFLGMEQAYYFHQGKMWLVSNSVRLLAQICKSSALDPLGISLFLTVGWVGLQQPTT